jgi:N-acetylneuraminate synthase
MQCNTNYSNSENNFSYINLNVLKKYKKIFDRKAVLGLSDHTSGHSTVLGAVALGARVVEKHFTDDNNRNGPDHKFSMNYKTWKLMVDETRRLERALGDGNKKIEKNEILTSYIQRRSYYSVREIKKGEKIKKDSVFPLRPYLKNSISPNNEKLILNKRAKKNIKKGECIKKNLIY